MIPVTFEPASLDAVQAIAANLRAADVAELAITSPGVPVQTILVDAMVDSRWSTVVRVDGLPTIAYGVAPTADPYIGAPWMLATPGLLKIRRFFVQHCREEVRLMQQVYPVLFNRVHRDNLTAIAWLEFCGFTVKRGPGPLFEFWKGALHV